MMKKIAIATMLSLGLLTSAGGVQANGLSSLFGQSAKQFLPVHEAFRPSLEQQGERIVVRFAVTPEHYIYQDKLSLKLPDGVTASDWQFDQAASFVDDPIFGKVAVFERDFAAIATLTSDQALVNQSIVLRWQGCAKAGLCYPPENTPLTINLSAGNHKAQQASKGNQAVNQTAKASQADGTKSATNQVAPKSGNAPSANQAVSQSASADNASKTANQQTAPAGEQTTNAVNATNVQNPSANPTANPDATQQASLNQADDNANANQQGDAQANANQANLDQNNANQVDLTTVNPIKLTAGQANIAQGAYALDHSLPSVQDSSSSPLLMIGLLFLAGILLSLTPCIYPMVPIVANIVAKQKNTSAKRGFVLSAAYSMGVATAYGALGALIAWLGQAIGIAGWLQRTEVLLVVAALFVLFAMMMADWVQIRLPSAISQRLHNQSQKADGYLGSVSGSFVAGALSALVVSPCVSAPMAGALTTVSMSGNVWFGFFALFALGLGLSVPLMIVGTAQGKFMPKAGEWTLKVRQLGALLLLAVALLLIERVLLSPMMLVLWAGWFVLLAYWLYRLANWGKWLAVLPLIWVGCLLYGSYAGSSDAWRPLTVASQTAGNQQYPDIKITTLAQLDEVLAQREQVLVDVTADWCVECRIMERTLFANRMPMLKQYQVVKLDISETTDDSRAILSRYQLFGPPALLVYRQGKLQQVLLGETKPDVLEQALTP